VSWQIFAVSETTATTLEAGLREAKVAHRTSIVDHRRLGGSVGEALDAGFRRLAIEGGDAELADAVAEVGARRLGHQTDMALITTDSDLLRTFAADQTVEGSIDRIVDHTPYPIDCGHVEGAFGERLFVNSVAAGVLASGSRWFPWWPNPLLPARAISVTVEGSVTEAVASGVLVLNGQFWGSWSIAPRSTLVDGVMDVQVFNGHRIALSRLRHSMRNGMHVRSHHVRRRSLADADIAAPSVWPVVVDGIRVGHGAFRVSCLPAAVRLAI
jgi:diacylglycerol kinase family enzyme